MAAHFEIGDIVQIQKQFQRNSRNRQIYTNQFGYIVSKVENERYGGAAYSIRVKLLYTPVPTESADNTPYRFQYNYQFEKIRGAGLLVDVDTSQKKQTITYPSRPLFSLFRIEATAKGYDLYSIFSDKTLNILPNHTFKTRWASVMSRSGDTRAVISKAIARSLTHGHKLSAALLAKVRELRGDLRKKRGKTRQQSWEENGVTCLYCGDKATDIDHYISAVQKGDQKIGKYLETEINLVPSCPKCHRAGKDNKQYRNANGGQDIIAWWENNKKSHGTNHPQILIKERLKREIKGRDKKERRKQAKEAIKAKLVAFHTFHEQYAPSMPAATHEKMAKQVNHALKVAYQTLQRELTYIDLTDEFYNNGPSLINEANQRFAAAIGEAAPQTEEAEISWSDFEDDSLKDVDDPSKWAFEEEEEGGISDTLSLDHIASLPVSDLKF